jgi:hypothetical protein
MSFKQEKGEALNERSRVGAYSRPSTLQPTTFSRRGDNSGPSPELARSSEAAKYAKIDLSDVDREKIKQKHGIETNEKIKIYDEIKRQKELWTYPYDLNKNLSQIRCHWDHHTFDNAQSNYVVCPLNYTPKQVAIKGQNEINTHIGQVNSGTTINSFVIKENIPRCKDINNLEDKSASSKLIPSATKCNSNIKNLIEVTSGYYETDGIFCSPECCLAFINNEKSKAGGSKYIDSERLLHSMLGLTKRILPANHYRLLEPYGGKLTIEQFRNNNKSVKYEYHGTTVLISHLFEKKLNISTD